MAGASAARDRQLQYVGFDGVRACIMMEGLIYRGTDTVMIRPHYLYKLQYISLRCTREGILLVLNGFAKDMFSIV